MTSGARAGSVSIDVTVHLSCRRPKRADLRLSGPSGTTLADILPLLRDAVAGRPGDGSISCGGRSLPLDAVLGLPPLVHGASLVIEEDAPDPAPKDSPRVGTGRAASPLDLVVIAGPDAGRRVPVGPDGVVVGRSTGLGLSLDDRRLSRQHMRITFSDNGFRVTDLRSTNGTRVGATLLTDGASADVVSGALITLGGSRLRLTRRAVTTAPTRPRGDGQVVVNRSPLTRPPRLAPTISAPTPPSPPARGRIPWIAAALPLPFAGLLALFFGPHMLAFALVSPVMLVGNVVGDRWGRQRDHRLECATHEAALAEQRASFEALRELEREQRWVEAPDPATVLQLATGPGTRIWERRAGTPEIGRVRLGVGALASRVGWSSQGQPTEHPLLADLPVVVDLGVVGGLGVAGEHREVIGLIGNVVGQLAALHSPRDLHLVVNGPGDGREGDPDEADPALSWARWLPHTTAYGSVPACLDTVRDIVTQRLTEGTSPGSSAPAVVVVLPHGAFGPGSGELVDLLDRGRAVGVWSVVGAGAPVELPGSCRAVVGLGQGASDSGARLDVEGGEPVADFDPDLVGWWWGERLGRSLAPLVDAAEGGGALPDTVDLLDLIPEVCTQEDPADSGTVSAALVADQWHLGHGEPTATVGRCPRDVWRIDLTRDGPHLLVGGTTGSGKSEFLRTLVASLAVRCSPADVTFILIDYKGGSAFAECAELPHTVGLVTNLDEGLARRALVSLTAEIRRREALLAASGARDFEEHRSRRGDLARLVIVIDEFRLLAVELPDFVDGVVQLAAVGRSLGVHLVLATQRPAGAITADIQANVNLRIAMRLRDSADSIDVIASPDAARIPADRPGRGLARGGDGALVAFQAAQVAGPRAVAARSVLRLDRWRRPVDREARAAPDAAPDRPDPSSALRAVARAASDAWTRTGSASPHRPWLPPLAEHLGLGDVGATGIALVDQPDRQCQHVLSHIGTGHWIVAGGPRSGRTTVLRTMLASYAASGSGEMQVQIVDTSGELADLEALPCVGSVVAAHEVTRVRRLFDRLRGLGAAGAAPASRTVLLIDGWERLDPDAEFGLAGLREELLDLLRSSGPHLRAVVTGDRSVFGSRVTAVAEQTFVLPLADPADATYAGLSRRDLPSTKVPGRAVRLGDLAEVQFALRDPLAEAVPGAVPPAGLIRLPRLPDLLTVDDLAAVAGSASAAGIGGPGAEGLDRVDHPIRLGLSAETGSAADWDLDRHGRRMLVVGPPRSGRTSTLHTVATALLDQGRTVAVVTLDGDPWDARSAAGSPASLIRVDPCSPEPLVAIKAAHPDVAVLVDDADTLDGTPAEPVLDDLLARVERDGGFVVAAATSAAVVTRFRGLLHSLSLARAGLLLGPRTPSDGEALGVRAPRGLSRTPGRALFVAGHHIEEVQLAVVTTASRRSSPDEGVG